MNKSDIIDLSEVQTEIKPFPHFYSPKILKNGLESQLYEWFENTDLWHFTQTDFYEQFEFDFFNAELPLELRSLVEEDTLKIFKNKIQNELKVSSLELVGVAAHKLVDTHRIGIHNDFIDNEETHRLVIIINPNWEEKKGGVLMLFNSADVSDLNKLVNPIDNSAFAFEISPNSYHAVSRIYDSTRYSIIYTFRRN